MPSTPYFETENLGARFRAAVQAALMEERISEVESDWLSQALEAEVPDVMSVEMVLNAQPLPGASLLIGYTDPQKPWTYRFSPLSGLHVHDSTAAAQIALQAPVVRLGLASVELTFLRMESAVFDQWSRRLIELQTMALSQKSSMLGALPDLRSALNGSLVKPFKTLLASTHEPHAHPVLLVDSKTDKALATSTLGKLAAQQFSGEAQGFGVKRCFLDEAGHRVSNEHAEAWEMAIQEAMAALPAHYNELLEEYWRAAAPGLEVDRKGYMALSLADDFARALLMGRDAGLLDTVELTWLSRALLPDSSDSPATQQDFVQLWPDNGRAFVDWAGVLVMRQTRSASQPVYLYCAHTGIRRFDNEAPLRQFLRDLTTEKMPLLGINAADRLRLQSSTRTSLDLIPMADPPFVALASSICDLLAANVAHALSEPGAQSATSVAKVDDALDIRALLDRRLCRLGNLGRWPTNDLAPRAVKLVQAPLQASDLTSRIYQLHGLAQRYAGLRRSQPDISHCIEELFAPGLATISNGHVEGKDLQVRFMDSTTSLVDFFLRRLVDDDYRQFPVEVELFDAKGEPLLWPTAEWLVDQVDTIKETFIASYRQRLSAYEEGSVRSGHGVLDIREETEAIYEALLRADLAEGRDVKRIGAPLLDLLENRLNNTPAGHFTQQRLFLRLARDDSRIAVSNSLVLGTADSSLVLQWNPISGLSGFATEAKMLDGLDRTLVSHVDLNNWCTLLAPYAASHLLVDAEGAPAHQPPAAVRLELMEGPIVRQLCQSDQLRRSQRHASDLTNAVHCRYGSVLMRRSLAAQEDPLSNALRDSMEHLINKRFNQYLPAWLNKAGSAQLEMYRTLLEKCAQLASPELSYLYGIPEMEDYAREHLQAALHRDDVQYPDDPDDIIITLTHVEGGLALPGQTPSSVAAATSVVSKTLTEFSLTHFSEFSSATMRVTVTVPGKKVPDPFYLRSLVGRLDIATPYRRLLARRLDAQNSDYRQRRGLFAMGLQANLLACAWQARLEGDLSKKALEYVAFVAAYPDGIARRPFKTVSLRFCQLQLQAAVDLAPDPVNGMFVIGPKGEDEGPVVLYTAYQTEHILREFKNPADLLSHLHSDKRLEALLLESVSDDVRVRYAHNGLLTPHIIYSSADLFDLGLPNPPAQLQLREITGNAFHYLYECNIATLLERAKDRTVTRAEANWKAWRELMRLGLQEATVLVPAELATLVNLWQSLDWLQASAEALKKRKWGEALAEFATALGTLAMSRDPHADTALDRNSLTVENTEAAQQLPAVVPMLAPDSSALRQLRSFEAQDIELGGMLLEPAHQLFHPPGAKTTYAAVAGHVYEVREEESRWYIFKDDKRGPEVRLRSDQQWEFYLSLRGGGDTSVQLASERIEHDLPKIFTVEATGMGALFQGHYSKYLQVRIARSMAIHLLTNALSNLSQPRPWEPMPARVRAILKQTFGNEVLPPRVLQRLKADCQALLKDIQGPSMDPDTSMRIITGYNKPGLNHHIAFTYRTDPQQRIFLTEIFFKIPDNLRMNSLARDIDLMAHFQATTLIHELTHSLLKTDDITYVAPVVADLSLLERDTPANLAYYNLIKQAWENGFTATTPSAELFKLADSTGMRDLNDKDGTAMATILRLTGCKTLDEARVEFANDPLKRADLILTNADSLSLLISRLGRYTPPA